ncbi:hypothetical protein J3E07_000283 [Methanococcus voltae]|uniref:DUF366 domain-containing protein n=2 Tax=Methanococcus voltae TaxID=2188 RepID=A0A8J7RZY2_METVO|nr:DUF366 family protein [Methanococcus voltae]MBP2200885.1 hypothetical protein [Methanococcus voltae]MCS3921609.1 hypothetical protein [Methanococcus voltae PS]
MQLNNNSKKLDFNSICGIKVNTNLDYTGEEIEPLWAFKSFDVQKDSIVGFIGAMQVKIANMKDLKDVKEEAEYEIPISSKRAINFIVEHFDNCDLKTTYLRQRMLVNIVKDVIETKANIKVLKTGDDLYYNNKKISVCIACKGVTSGKIHLGLNVTSEGTPEHVSAIGLLEMGLNESDLDEILENIILEYCKETDKIERDIRKTLPLF